MSYSKYFLNQDKKIPVPLMIAAVLLIIFFISKLFTSSPIPSRAVKKTVKSLQIVNPIHNQAGIFWQTDEKETGWVIYGKNEVDLEKVATDERDMESKRKTYLNHLVYLKDLAAGTKYYFKVVSNNLLIADKSDKAFYFTTPKNISMTYSLNPAYGKIIRENGESVEGAIVKMEISGSFPLITLSKASGEWLIPMNTVVNKKSLNSATPNSQDKINIMIYDEQTSVSQIDADIGNLSPVPQTIIIGNNYKFLGKEEVLSAAAKNNAKTEKIDILFPMKNSLIPEGKPLIKGIAIPGSEVDVEFDSKKENLFKTVADKEGVWRVILTKNLSPGSHSLKLTSKDVNDKIVVITREFTIAKSGEQVLAAATAEASPTTTPSLTPTTSVLPTTTTTPFFTPIPTVSTTPPTSGVNMLPIGVASVSLIILGLGIMLAF